MAQDPNVGAFMAEIFGNLTIVSQHLKEILEDAKVSKGNERVAVRSRFSHLESQFKNVAGANGGLGILEQEVKRTNSISSSLRKFGFKTANTGHGSIGSRLKDGTISLQGITANRQNDKIDVCVWVKNKTSKSTFVEIPKGTAFENSSKTHQNISAGESVRKFIPAKATRCLSFVGFCINDELSWPSNSSLTLTILQCLRTMNVLDTITANTIENINKAQSAIWEQIKITRDALAAI